MIRYAGNKVPEESKESPKVNPFVIGIKAVDKKEKQSKKPRKKVEKPSKLTKGDTIESL